MAISVIFVKSRPLVDFIKKHSNYILLLLPIVSLVLHFHVLPLDLIGIHVWRQTETQTTINNFFREDMNILNPRNNEFPEAGRLHRMELPIMQWLFALVYKAFGYHIIISRMLSFVIGLCSVWGIYRLIDTVSGRREIATIGAWAFNFSPVFYYYTVNPSPDNMALCGGIWSLAWFCAYAKRGGMRAILFCALFLSLATLCKLPFIIYGAFMATYLLRALIKQELAPGHFTTIVGIFLLCLLPAVAWYAWVMPGWVIGAVRGIADQSMNHPDLTGVMVGTVVSVLPELLINYASLLFFITGFYVVYKHKLYSRALFLPFAVTGLVVIFYFLFEMNIIDLVHDYYMFPFLPFLFILVAYGAAYLLQKRSYTKWLAMLCLVALPLTAFLRIDTRWDVKDPGFTPAYLKHRDELRKLTPRDALCIVGYDDSHYILLYYIDRKGWAFDKATFNIGFIDHCLYHGADYIFLDEAAYAAVSASPHLGEKIFDKDGLMVYKLK